LSFFAANLRFLRKKHQITSSDLALVLGVWEDILLRYEQGNTEPGTDALIALADHFHVPLDHLLREDLEARHRLLAGRDIQLILLDVDGTLTDGALYYTEQGDEIKRFHAHDGMVIHRLIRRKNIQFGIVSASPNENILQRRANALGIQRLYFGTRPKVEVVDEWLAESGLNYSQIAYVGDDLNDLPLIRKAGLSACPADAVPQVKQAVHTVLKRNGGHACVREFLEEVMGFNVSD
jgi:YrbI family 3-deoxy-D-manno-octulosonate 8-phosphate phosphatase